MIKGLVIDGSQQKSRFGAQIELERVTDPARRPGPEEKLVINKLNTQHYSGPNLSQACELFSRTNSAREHAVSTMLKQSTKKCKSS